ncbi:MAG: hypothetical protein H6R18_1253 [Proteobacteria bacterium]|nr:hypothetical protein [Pseudomonadota bacterium]
MAAPDFSSIISVVSAAVPAWVAAVLAIGAALCVVLVVWVGSGHVLAAIRGQVYYGGLYWDADVYQNAMNDLNRQQRKGVALDAESRRALRRHQGFKI